MKYTYKELKTRPIQPLPDNPEPYIYYYLDKGFEKEKNYHMYFYYENGQYDILDSEDGIYDLSEEIYLKNMRNSLFDIVAFSLFNEVLDVNYPLLQDLLDKNDEIDYFLAVKKLIGEDRVEEDEKIFLKDYYIEEIKRYISQDREDLEPLQEKFATLKITKKDLDLYNELKDNISKQQSEIDTIEDMYRLRDLNKDLLRITKLQKDLLITLKKS